jgi:hypothetical protein
MVVQSHDGPPAVAMMSAEVSQFESLSATKPFAGGTINSGLLPIKQAGGGT